MKSIILCCSLILLCSSRLLHPRDFKDQFKSQQELKDRSVTTSCNKVDVTKFSSLLPTTQSIYAGYLNVASGSKSGLGYIFYGSQLAKTPQDIAKYSTLIWLNGGPGSSSQTGNFLELGPIRINADGTQSLNKYSWDTEYNVMFVDQPIGTGYSVFANTDEIPINQAQLGQHFIYAWAQFLTADTGCVKSQKLQGLLTSPWFVFGESYAGKFVPTISKAALDFTDFKIPLKGAGIGDGFTDPMTLLKELPSFGFNLGLSDYQERQVNEKAALGGVLKLQKGNFSGGTESFYQVLDAIIEQSGGVNVYNIFVLGTYDDVDDQVQTYLNAAETKTILGFIPEYDYSLASPEVFEAFSDDFMKSDCVLTVESILKTIPVIIYNGQNDMIVPNPGTLRWVYNLNYEDSSDFKKKDFEPWIIDNTIVGYKKQAGKLEFRIVNKAGHLVPMDQPVAALDMIRSFVKEHENK